MKTPTHTPEYFYIQAARAYLILARLTASKHYLLAAKECVRCFRLYKKENETIELVYDEAA